MENAQPLQHRCGQCGRIFSKREHLQRHARVHTRERPFRCPYCVKTFSRSDVVRRHMRTHTNKQSNSGSAIPISTQAATASAASAKDSNATVSRQQLVPSASPIAAEQAQPSCQALQNQPQHELEESQCQPSLLPSDVWSGAPLWDDPLPLLATDDFSLGSLDAFLADVVTEWANIPVASPSAIESSPLVTAPKRDVAANEDAGESGNVNDRCTIDEQYSNRVSQQLRTAPGSPNTKLSAAYLKLCLDLFLTQFQPIFPIVHTPTFRLREHNALLLASMCSIGSLCIGSKDAAVLGAQLYSRLNKAILASWEPHLIELSPSSLPLVQAAVLSQTFGILSKRSGDRFIAESFQGTLLAWARQVGAFTPAQSRPALAPDGLSGSALHNAWEAWARTEEVRRLSLALYVHDAETACLFHRQPLLRHQAIVYHRLHPFDDDDVFQATTAVEWQKKCLVKWSENASAVAPVKVASYISDDTAEHQSDDSLLTLARLFERSKFTSYAFLANIGACWVDQAHIGDVSDANVAAHANALRHWAAAFASRPHSNNPPWCADELGLRVLLHNYGCLLYADISLLERALLRSCVSDNAIHSSASTEKNEAVTAAKAWATSDRGYKALLHACLVQRHASALQLGTIPPVHLPRAVFAAGLIFAAHAYFGPASVTESTPTQGSAGGKPPYLLPSEWERIMLGMPGIEHLARSENMQPAQLAVWACDQLAHHRFTLPYTCTNLLAKLNIWGVSAVFADKLLTCLASGKLLKSVAL